MIHAGYRPSSMIALRSSTLLPVPPHLWSANKPNKVMDSPEWWITPWFVFGTLGGKVDAVYSSPKDKSLEEVASFQRPCIELIKRQCVKLGFLKAIPGPFWSLCPRLTWLSCIQIYLWILPNTLMGKVTWLQVYTCNASTPEAEAEGSSQAECPMCTKNFWVCHWKRHLTSLGLTSLLRMIGMTLPTLGYWEARMIVTKAVRYPGRCLSITSPSRWMCSMLIWCSQTAVTPDCVSVTVLCCSDNPRV